MFFARPVLHAAYEDSGLGLDFFKSALARALDPAGRGFVVGQLAVGSLRRNVPVHVSVNPCL